MDIPTFTQSPAAPDIWVVCPSPPAPPLLLSWLSYYKQCCKWTSMYISSMYLWECLSKKIPTNEIAGLGSMCILNLLFYSENIVQICTPLGSIWNASFLTPFYHWIFSMFKIVLIMSEKDILHAPPLFLGNLSVFSLFIGDMYFLVSELFIKSFARLLLDLVPY